MMSPDDFTKKWKWGELSKASPNALKVINISVPAKDFLVLAGLPRKTEGGEQLQFDLEKEELPVLAKLLGTPGPGSQYCHFHKIGNCLVSHVCVDERNEGIYVVHSLIGKVQFLNSSVPQLAESILASAQLVEMFVSGEREYENYSDRKFAPEWLRKQLETIDSAVLRDPKSLWSNVLFDLTPGPDLEYQDED